MKCVSCRSTDVKKISAVIAQGTKEINLGHGFLGVGATTKSLGIGGAKGKTGGTITSGLAKKLANRRPDTPKGYFDMIMAFALISGIWVLLVPGGSGIGYTIGAAIIGTVCFKKSNEEKKQYEKEYEKFTRLWYCYKCNGVTLQGKRK